jgi:hypothetical protein
MNKDVLTAWHGGHFMAAPVIVAVFVWHNCAGG